MTDGVFYFRHPLKRVPVPVTAREVFAKWNGVRACIHSVPKSGTNLLLQVFSHLPWFIPRVSFAIGPGIGPHQIPAVRRGQYFASHLHWSQELIDALDRRGVKTVFIYRDLRDITVSRMYYHSKKLTTHPAYAVLNQLADDDARLMATIDGLDEIRGYSAMRTWISGYLSWLRESTCLKLRFEDLIGEGGGGTSELQRRSLGSSSHFSASKVMPS